MKFSQDLSLAGVLEPVFAIRTEDDLGIGDRTTIEYFDGPHMINGVGTFKFLHEQLKWPG